MPREAERNLETKEGRVELFSRVSRFSSFTLAEKETLAAVATVRSIRAGASIYVHRSPADSFAVIAAGIAIKESVTNRRPIGAYNVIGTLPLLHRSQDQRFRTVGLKADTNVTLAEIHYKSLQRLAPERLEFFLDSIAEEAMAVIERVDH